MPFYDVYLSRKLMPIRVKIPIEKTMIITTSRSLAKFACPSWSSITDESALRSALASLDDPSSSLHWWLGFWTFLVAAGVVLEVIFVVWEYLDEMRDFRRGEIHPPERPHTTLFVLGVLGASLVAVGVSGEVWKESQIATLETCIRKGDDALFLLLSKEAGDARDSAVKAKEAADLAGIASTKAQKKADAATVSASNAIALSEKAETQVGEVEAKRAKLEKSLENLAICNAPRILQIRSWGSGSNWKSSIDPLKKFPRQQFIIEYEPQDAEVRRAKEQIKNALKAADWVIVRETPHENLHDGVEVQDFWAERQEYQIAAWEAIRAQQALVVFLHSYFWQAKEQLSNNDAELIRDPKVIPPGAIRIQIGMYPASPFIVPPGAEEAAAVGKKIDDELSELKRKSQEQNKKEQDAFLKTLDSENAAAYRKAIAEFNKEDELDKERMRESPCRPLSSLFPK